MASKLITFKHLLAILTFLESEINILLLSGKTSEGIFHKTVFTSGSWFW